MIGGIYRHLSMEIDLGGDCSSEGESRKDSYDGEFGGSNVSLGRSNSPIVNYAGNDMLNTYGSRGLDSGSLFSHYIPSKRNGQYAGGVSLADRLCEEARDSREERSSYDIFVDYMERNFGRKDFPEIYSSYVMGGGVELSEEDRIFAKVEYELLKEQSNGGAE